jgi:Mg2+ and Co2+ transporter CorA
LDTSRQEDPLEKKGKGDSKRKLRRLVYLLLPDGLMIALAVVMVPVVLLPIILDLTPTVVSTLSLIDWVILSIFIAEYLLKTLLAPNIWKHVINPWHLLDLLIIAIPLINLLPMFSSGLAKSSLFLRLFRIIRIVVVGGRAVDRRVKLEAAEVKSSLSTNEMEIQVVDGTLAGLFNKVPFDNVRGYLDGPNQTWVNISYVGENDYERLSQTLGIPEIILESELVEDSYPHLDYFEHYSLIFARIADIQTSNEGTSRLMIKRSGLLIVCQGRNIITLAKNKTDTFDRIVERARKIHKTGEPLAVDILYTILRYIVEKDKQIIGAMEQELINIENTPLKEWPDNFLETTFLLRKEVNQLVPALLHLKEIIAVITSKRVPLEGFSDGHEHVFDILNDEASYLHETASNARDSLLSLIDLYINTTSYETNKVMRVIAVITSLGIIPAVMGLLGSNIIGNPWDIQLWQVFTVLGILMLAMGWVFYRLGWLKG